MRFAVNQKGSYTITGILSNCLTKRVEQTQLQYHRHDSFTISTSFIMEQE